MVGALLVREVATRFGNKPGGYVWAIIDPVAHIVLLTLIFSALTRSPPLGTSFVLFFATGFLGFQFYQSMSGYVTQAVKSNKALLSYPAVAPIDAVVARIILQAFTSALVAVIVLSVVIAFFVRFAPDIRWWLVIEAGFAGMMLGAGVSLMNIVLFARYPLYDKLFSIINRPLFLISGVFFLPDAIPHPYREYVLYNPLVHVVMMFRQGFYPEYRAIGLDEGYLYGFITIVFFIGMTCFTLMRRTLRSMGE